MQLPRRSVQRSQIIQLPSIQTTFPLEYDSNKNTNTTIHYSKVPRDDGIEVVPLERQNSSSAKELTPSPEEKEVVPSSKLLIEITSKPLPSLPPNRWKRLSVKNRILIILCVQFCTLLTIGLGLLGIKGHAAKEQLEEPRSPTLPSESHFPPLQQGTFTVDIGIAQQQSSACIAQNNQSAAWSCTMNYEPLQISLSTDQLANKSTLATGRFNNLTSGALPNYYGLQPPTFQPIPLETTTDADSLSLGYAYHFNITYNRTVFLPVQTLSDKGVNSGNGIELQPGDDFWSCAFPYTTIEGYLYVYHNSSAATRNASTTTRNSTAIVTTPLPYVFKLTEQHFSNSTPPSCVQMQTLQNGSVAISPDQTAIELKMSDPYPVVGRVVRDLGLSFRNRQDTMANTCRCQWMVQ